jgi:hypothetical protein
LEVEKRGIKADRYPKWIKTEAQQDWSFSFNSLGFEYDLPQDLTSEHWVTDNSIQFIEEQLNERPEQPYFLHASYIAPHHPFGVVKEFNTYKPEEMELPPSWSVSQAVEFRKERGTQSRMGDPE